MSRNGVFYAEMCVRGEIVMNKFYLFSLLKIRNPSEKLFCLVFKLQVVVPVH